MKKGRRRRPLEEFVHVEFQCESKQTIRSDLSLQPCSLVQVKVNLCKSLIAIQNLRVLETRYCTVVDPVKYRLPFWMS